LALAVEVNIPEKAYLGTVLKENYLINETVITKEHLEDDRHKELFAVIKELVSQGKPADRVTLAMHPKIQAIGGLTYINELLNYSDPSKFEEYEELVFESWREKQKNKILTQAKLEDWDIDRLMNEFEKINFKKVDDHASIRELLLEMSEAPWNEEYIQQGATTGIKRLNDAINGFQPSEFTIIAARPSMGKTDVMLHFAKQVGWQGYLPVVFSLEMPAKKLAERLIASTGRYNRMKLRNPKKYLTDEQKKTWHETIGIVDKTNIQIFDQSWQSVPEMRAKVRQIMHKYPDKKPVVFIDYLTLIRPQNHYNGSAHQQVTEISQGLKNMAKDFDIPVVCLAQLNREVEKRADKRPMMSDIRESGSVEQDADNIIFLYREKYYSKESDSDKMELIVAKARNGATLTIEVRYNEATGEIRDEYY
jgi:DnaB-like helicase N terminal domain./DnaB-like helicase C terminal domain.